MYYREPNGLLIQDDVSIGIYYLQVGMDPNLVVENMGARLLKIAESNTWRAKDARLLLILLEDLCQSVTSSTTKPLESEGYRSLTDI